MTLALLWAMQYLVSGEYRASGSNQTLRFVDFVRVKRAPAEIVKTVKPKKPPLPETPPPQPPLPRFKQSGPVAGKLDIAAVPIEVDVDLNAAGYSLDIGEGDYLPIVKVAPVYPRRALSLGIEGHCVVDYTVTEQGTVRDVRVVDDECTSPLFRDASVAAARQFKYKPRIADGQRIEVRGVRNRFVFKIEQ